MLKSLKIAYFLVSVRSIIFCGIMMAKYTLGNGSTVRKERAKNQDQGFNLVLASICSKDNTVMESETEKGL
jgi:hypothetical protein